MRNKQQKKLGSLVIIAKRLNSLFLTLAMIFGILYSCQSVKAADNYMKKLPGVSYIKPDKATKFKINLPDVGYKKMDLKVFKGSIKQSKNTGYKIIKFSVNILPTFDLSKSEVDNIYNSDYVKKQMEIDEYEYNLGGNYYMFFVDYKTGKNIDMSSNNLDIKFDWDDSFADYMHAAITPGRVEYPGTGDNVIYFAPRKIKFTIECPDKYVNRLCFLVCGDSNISIDQPVKNQKFESGNGKFGNTTYCNKDVPGLCKAIRLNLFK